MFAGRYTYVIHDGATGRAIFPETKEQAVTIARRLIADGNRLDAGLAQINSENWSWLGLDVERVFDPCSNLAAGEQVLLSAYTSDPHTVDAALSRYNTGHATRGIRNGYVGRVKSWLNGVQPEHGYPLDGVSADSVGEGRSVEVQGSIAGASKGSAEMAELAGKGTSSTPGPTTPAWHFQPVSDGFGEGG